MEPEDGAQQARLLVSDREVGPAASWIPSKKSEKVIGKRSKTGDIGRSEPCFGPKTQDLRWKLVPGDDDPAARHREDGIAHEEEVPVAPQ